MHLQITSHNLEYFRCWNEESMVGYIRRNDISLQTQMKTGWSNLILSRKQFNKDPNFQYISVVFVDRYIWKNKICYLFYFIHFMTAFIHARQL